METPLLQLFRTAAGQTGDSTPLADQLGGQPMDVAALELKLGLHHRDVQMGLATAYLRVLGDADRRANEIMKA